MLDQYTDRYLMQALNFTTADLAANRGGTLTDAQKERLRERIGKGQTQIIVIVMLVLLIFFGVMGFMFFNDESSGLRKTFEENPTIVIAGLGGSILLYLVMVVFALLRGQRAKSGNFKVDSIEGQLKLSSSEMDYGTARAVSSVAGAQTRICIIQIGRQKIYVDESTFDAFVNGQRYRLYYVGWKPAYMIVSAEVLGTSI